MAVWVQCEMCDKWRRVPTQPEAEAWYCDMHPVELMASCDAPEEAFDDDAEEVVDTSAPPPAAEPPAHCRRAGRRARASSSGGGTAKRRRSDDVAEAAAELAGQLPTLLPWLFTTILLPLTVY